jgi:alcohol dehydrogenase
MVGGNDGSCQACRDGDAIDCLNLQVPGLAYPSGYAEETVVPVSALARIPGEPTFIEAICSRWSGWAGWGT